MFISCCVVKAEVVGEVIPVLEENNRHHVSKHYSRGKQNVFLFCIILLYYIVSNTNELLQSNTSL
jgi:hypothetical protein